MAGIPLHARDGSIRAHALVDAADFEWLNRWRWSLHGEGYVARTHGSSRRPGHRTVLMHREILGLPRGDPRKGDHINGDPLDNRRENLRIASNSENGQNRRGGYGRSSHRGVTWNRYRGAWQAQAHLAGRCHFLGYFVSEEDAAAAAAQFRREHMPHATR